MLEPPIPCGTQVRTLLETSETGRHDFFRYSVLSHALVLTLPVVILKPLIRAMRMDRVHRVLI